MHAYLRRSRQMGVIVAFAKGPKIEEEVSKLLPERLVQL